MKATLEQLNTFAAAIDTAIATPGEHGVNDGRLMAPYNRDNLRTATFTANRAPELDAIIRHHAPFSPDSPISVSLRHSFDPTGGNDFVYQVRPADQPDAQSLTAVGWMHDELSEPRYFIQAPHEAVDLSEQQFAGMSADFLRPRVPDIDNFLQRMPLRNALALAALELRSQPLDERMTKEVGIKTASNSATMNGFRLEAYRFDHESSTEAAYSLAGVAIHWSFTADSYDGIYRGAASRRIEVRQEGQTTRTNNSRHQKSHRVTYE